MTPTALRRTRLLWLLVVAVVACAPGDEVPTPRPAPAEPDDRDEAERPAHDEEALATGRDADAPPRPADETGLQPVAPASAEPQQSEDFPTRSEDETVRLVDARLIRVPGVDRLVLELDGPVPSWRVQRVSPPILEQPGRAPVDVPGERFLEARLVPATTLERDAPDPTAGYQGPIALGDEARGAGVLEAMLTADHDGWLVWTLGLEGQREVAVGVLEDPDRLVVDVVAPAG